MSDHTYRKGYAIDPFAEWVRRQLPGAREGIVRADLDTAFRRYGDAFGLDASGDLMLIEQKSGDESVTGGEWNIYNSIGRLIDGSLPKERYRGAHLLRIRYLSYPAPCDKCGRPVETADEAYARFLAAVLELGNESITHEKLKAFLLGS